MLDAALQLLMAASWYGIFAHALKAAKHLLGFATNGMRCNVHTPDCGGSSYAFETAERGQAGASACLQLLKEGCPWPLLLPCSAVAQVCSCDYPATADSLQPSASSLLQLGLVHCCHCMRPAKRTCRRNTM